MHIPLHGLKVSEISQDRFFLSWVWKWYWDESTMAIRSWNILVNLLDVTWSGLVPAECFSIPYRFLYNMIKKKCIRDQ